MTSPGDLLQAILADPANDDLRLVFADLLDDRGEGERAEFIRVQCELARLQAEEVARFNEETDWSQCTGIAASWCPNCGDCVCPFPEDERCSPNCPLHNRHSSHCCLEDIADKRERLRERERELFERCKFSGWVEPLRVATDRTFSNLHCLWNQGGQAINLRWSRGFISSVTCTYADWAQHADAITARCPIERVTLTTMPEVAFDFRYEQFCTALNGKPWIITDYPHDGGVLSLLKHYWPRIAFTLPSEVAV